MPFPKTWIEELALEWLQLKGFASLSNLPIGTTQVGGRFEADIVGARISGATLEIWHIETGQLAGGENSVQSVKKKFSAEITENIDLLFKEMFCFTSNNVNHQRLYIATYWTDRVVRNIGALEIKVQVKTVRQFIMEQVLGDIAEWKANPPQKPKIKGNRITLPESYWLLQMLDYLDNKNLVNRS